MMRLLKRKTVKTDIEEKLSGYSHNDTILFMWICSVRILPFLEWNGTFDYWPENERQKFLLSALKAVDAIAFATYGDAHAIADYSAINVFDAIAAFESCNDATILNTITIIARAVAYTANIKNNTAHEVADSTAYGLHVNMEDILLQDLGVISVGGRNFSSDISIYDYSWANFQKALHDLDCSYWADWYADLFKRGFVLDEKDKIEIKLRLDAPYRIVAEGAASISQYMISKTKRERQMMSEPGLRAKVFLSYSWKDENLADSIDRLFADAGITLIRDKRDIEYRDSIKQFMKQIRFNDYVVLVISPDYLKSVNCMYEIAELTKDEDYKTRILPVVKKETGIFDPIGRNTYIVHWQDAYKKLYADSEKIDPLNKGEIISDLVRYERIMRDLPAFLTSISDMNIIQCEDSISIDEFNKIKAIVDNPKI